MLALSTLLIVIAEFDPRHVDSAQVYKNEAQVADAVRESGLDRAKVFKSIAEPQGSRWGDGDQEPGISQEPAFRLQEHRVSGHTR